MFNVMGKKIMATLYLFTQNICSSRCMINIGSMLYVFLVDPYSDKMQLNKG